MSTSNQILPTHFKPLHYSLKVNCLKIQEGVFSGECSIDFLVNKASNKVCLNTRDITVLRAAARLGNGHLVNLTLQHYDDTSEVLVLTFEEELSDDFTLEMRYEGAIQTNMTGFYRSQYPDLSTGVIKSMYSTQFQATDARRAYPCLDEPMLKATFDITIVASSDLTVLSNMPLKQAKVQQDGAQTTHIFHTSPKMSPYLLAWAIGEFEYIETHTEKCIYPSIEDSSPLQNLPIRVYTARGKSQQGQFALDLASKVIDYYSDLFEIPYPIPKLDLLCVESYSHNAMENFSLITFRPTALLLDGLVENNSLHALQKIAYVVCHEIAHQWFGNLVTMKWWDELWLNEGFATWIGYYAVNWMFPEWDVPSLVMWKSHEVAMELDSLKESHAVKVEVKNAKDIDQVFDTISYLKGCSILEMLGGYLGTENFIKGVALYLKRNAFSNATMNDLLDSVGEVCNIDVLSRVQDWIINIGYPILKVESFERKPGWYKLSQKRYLSGSQTDCTGPKWWVPLMLFGDESNSELYLWDQSNEFELRADRLVHLNTNGYGFYRVAYGDEKLLDDICENIAHLSSRGKIGLISDVESTANAQQFLHVLSCFLKHQNPYDYYVWAVIFQATSRLLSLFDDLNALEFHVKVINFINSAISRQIDGALSYLHDPDSVLLNFKDSRRHLKALFYEEVLLVAGKISEAKTVGECEALFTTQSISSANRLVILTTVLSQAHTSEKTLNIVVSELKTATLAHKECLLTALGNVRNPVLFPKVFELIFQIETMDVQFLAEALGANPLIRMPLWGFIKKNYGRIYHRIGSNPTVIERFVRFTTQNFVGPTLKAEVRQFFAEKDVSSFDRALNQALEKIDRNTIYVDNNTSKG
ncbi:LADA_0F11254g1_1 [Lachancea dasiensis]|uniref:Aminopeptidase n=1 Tax=Lachancea dasiensis TaxID=1072105 RepID=A0A1G4JMN5_9SACH|nr:LADA_0F11254g1_1 [Lachancea dasiensis]